MSDQVKQSKPMAELAMKPARSVSGATGTGKSNTLIKVLLHELQRSAKKL